MADENKLARLLAGMPPLDDEQRLARNKLAGTEWMKGPDGKYIDEEQQNRIQEMRSLYSIYDKASRVPHPMLFPLMEPSAASGIGMRLLPEVLRRLFNGAGKPGQDAGDY